MSILSFLNTAKVEEVARAPRVGGGAKKPWNPPTTVLAVRVWRDGSVFPSQALVERFNLEYPSVTITKGEEIPWPNDKIQEHLNKQMELPEADRKELKPRYKPSLIEPIGGVAGNGFDVIDSRVWAGYKAQGNMLFISAVSKQEPKVDLFGATKYDANGVPISKVLEQGSKTFGKLVLLNAIEELYGIKLDTSKEYVDMLVLEELQVGDSTINFNKQFSVPVMLAPKLTNRGKDKGKPDYERREGSIVFGFIPDEVVNGKVTIVNEEGSERERKEEHDEKEEMFEHDSKGVI